MTGQDYEVFMKLDRAFKYLLYQKPLDTKALRCLVEAQHRVMHRKGEDDVERGRR